MSTRRYAPRRGTAMTRSTPRRPAAEELEEEDDDDEEFDYSDPYSAEADDEDIEEEDFQRMPSRSSPVTMIFTFPPRGNFLL